MPYVPSILLAFVAGCSVPLTVTMVVRSAQIASVSTSVAVSPDGRLLASGGGDGTIKIWDLATGRMIRTLPGSGETILSVAISPDGRWLVSGGGAVSGGGLIKVWDIAAGRTVRTFDTHRGPVLVFLSSDGRWMVSSGDGGGVWEFAAGRKVANHVFVTDSVGAAVTPDGALVVFAAGHELAILDPANDRVVRTISGHTGDVYCVAISPDGRQVVSGGADGVIKVWDLATGGEMRTLSGHAGPVESVAISPDGRWVISGSRDHAIKIWDLGTGRLVRTLTGHATDVSSVAVSPDGRWVVSAAGDIKVWELATGRLVRTLYHAPSGQGMDTRLSAGLNERC